MRWKLEIPPFQLSADVIFESVNGGRTRSCTKGHRPSRVALNIMSFNCLSVAEKGKSGDDVRTGLHDEIGRVETLEKCMSFHGILIPGLQETRTASGVARSGPYHRICSGCDSHGNFGTEIWLHSEKPLDASGRCGGCFQPRHCTALHSEPTCLIVKIQHPLLTCNVASLHAPHRGRSMQDRLQWWSRVRVVMKSAHCASLWIICADANVRLGSITGASVEDFQADAEDDAGAAFRLLVEDPSAFTPSTFEWAMWGDGVTVFQKRNHQLQRSDFIAVPELWKHRPVQAWVAADVHAGHVSLDHFAVIASIDLQCGVEARATGRRRRFDPQLLLDQHVAQRVQEGLWQIP